MFVVCVCIFYFFSLLPRFVFTLERLKKGGDAVYETNRMDFDLGRSPWETKQKSIFPHGHGYHGHGMAWHG